jgi:hypothetical protein
MNNLGELMCACNTAIQCKRCKRVQFLQGEESLSKFTDRLDLLGWEAKDGTAICQGCASDFINDCVVCGKPIYHGEARVRRVNPPGSDNWEDLHLQCEKGK